MATKCFSGVLLALICVCLFMTSHGGKNDRQVRTHRSADTVIYCREMKWLNKYQRKLCYRFPKMIEPIKDGVKHALKECRRQFSSFRWNCSSLDWKQVLTDGGILKKRSRETAFVQALTSASVMMKIAKVCVEDKTRYCGCGRLSRQDRQDVSILDGCGDNINFGAYLAANFMDPKQVKSHAKKTKRHNHIAGRKIVRQNTQRKCDCHSYLTGCRYKICRRIVPEIQKVGDEIWKLYQNPIRSHWNKTTRRLFRKTRISRKTIESHETLQGKLVYFKKSEDFCEPNYSMGIVGTHGRACNSTSNDRNGCATMCCGRPFQTVVVVETVKCNCRFVWAAFFDVKCDVCKRARIMEKCL